MFSLRISLVRAYISSQFAGGSILTLPSLPVIFFAGVRRAFFGFFGDAIVAIETSWASCFTVTGEPGPVLRFLAGRSSPSALEYELSSESEDVFSFFCNASPFAMFARERV
jgi:hypothetical protein